LLFLILTVIGQVTDTMTFFSDGDPRQSSEPSPLIANQEGLHTPDIEPCDDKLSNTRVEWKGPNKLLLALEGFYIATALFFVGKSASRSP
jgi:hypothetical protein